MRRLLALAALAALVALAAVLLTRRRRPVTFAPSAGEPPAPEAPPSAAEAPRFVSVPWELVGPPPEDRDELAIRYRAAQGMALDRIDAQETPTQVFVTVLMRWEPSAQPAGEHEHEATVPLSRPLGARELLHAPVDDPPVYP